ncbi:MAG: hypothetical protein ABIB71_07285, partial [Candidatus Woesearchaeota archaeon]
MKKLLAAGLFALVAGCASGPDALDTKMEETGMPAEAKQEVQKISKVLSSDSGLDDAGRAEALDMGISLYIKSKEMNVSAISTYNLIHGFNKMHIGREDVKELEKGVSFVLDNLPAGNINSYVKEIPNMSPRVTYGKSKMEDIAKVMVAAVLLSKRSGMPISDFRSVSLADIILKSNGLVRGQKHVSPKDMARFLLRIGQAAEYYDESLRSIYKTLYKINYYCSNLGTSDNIDKFADAVIGVMAAAGPSEHSMEDFYVEVVRNKFECGDSLYSALKKINQDSSFESDLEKLKKDFPVFEAEFYMGSLNEPGQLKKEVLAVEEHDNNQTTMDPLALEAEMQNYMPLAIEQYIENPLTYEGKRVEISAYPASHIIYEKTDSYALKLVDDGFSLDCLDNGVTNENLMLHNDIEYIMNQNEKFADKKVTVFGTLKDKSFMLDAVEV